jgi:hypothetical protein
METVKTPPIDIPKKINQNRRMKKTTSFSNVSAKTAQPTKPVVVFDVTGSADDAGELPPWYHRRYSGSARDAAFRDYGLIQGGECNATEYAGKALHKRIDQVTLDPAGAVLETREIKRESLKGGPKADPAPVADA